MNSKQVRRKMDLYERDLEKHPAEAGVGNVSWEKRPSYVDSDTGAVPGESFEYGTSVFAKAQRLAGKFKIEQRGIERVPENERTDDKHPYLNVATMVSPGDLSWKRLYKRPTDAGS